jgi:hypothetical protein
MGMLNIPTKRRSKQRFIPPPEEPFLFRVGAFFKRHLNNIISHPVCAFFFAAAVACVVGVWLSTGELFAIVPVLALGWLCAALGWWWAPNLSSKVKVIWIILTAFPMLAEGYVLRSHLASGVGGIEGGASVRITVVPPRKLNDGYAFPVAVQNTGKQSVLNYSYHFRQSLVSGILTVAEENKEFDSATKAFYSDVQLAKRIKIDAIANSLGLHEVIQLTQPGNHFDDGTFAAISQGKQFLYNFLIFRYTDPNSRGDNKYYDAEFCARYDPAGGFQECTFHNFIKKPEQ